MPADLTAYKFQKQVPRSRFFNKFVVFFYLRKKKMTPKIFLGNSIKGTSVCVRERDG